MTTMPLSVYLTHTDNGQSVHAQGWMGGDIMLWNPSTSLYEVHSIGFNGVIQHCFNNTAFVDGTANQSLVNGKHYYVYMFLNAGTPTINFISSLPSSRYDFTSDGYPIKTDSQGNKCTLLGAVSPVSGNIGNIMGGQGARVVTVSSPWGAKRQTLPCNAGEIGKLVTSTSYTEITEMSIIACSWAWEGATSHIAGRIAENSGLPALFIQPFAKNLVTNDMYYGATVIAQFPSAGFNIPYAGNGVELALDDGVYKFGIMAKVTNGACQLTLEHVVNSLL